MLPNGKHVSNQERCETTGSPHCTKVRTCRATASLPPRKASTRAPPPRRTYRNPIVLAKGWRKALNGRVYPSQADLGRREV
jgi:hypothetical protein